MLCCGCLKGTGRAISTSSQFNPKVDVPARAVFSKKGRLSLTEADGTKLQIFDFTTRLKSKFQNSQGACNIPGGRCYSHSY